MKRVYLGNIYGYPKDEIFRLASDLGKELIDYLEEELFLLLIDSKMLLQLHEPKTLQETWKLHPASKSLEGFLEKIITKKRLYEEKDHTIGQVFGKYSKTLRKKINDRKLIAKTKSTWDFCRNDVMHYQKGKKYKYDYMKKRFEEIIEVMVLLYEDQYGKTENNNEIRDGLENYVFSKHRSKKYRFKQKLITFIRGL